MFGMKAKDENCRYSDGLDWAQCHVDCSNQDKSQSVSVVGRFFEIPGSIVREAVVCMQRHSIRRYWPIAQSVGYGKCNFYWPNLSPPAQINAPSATH